MSMSRKEKEGKEKEGEVVVGQERASKGVSLSSKGRCGEAMVRRRSDPLRPSIHPAAWAKEAIESAAQASDNRTTPSPSIRERVRMLC